ncbi:hypothetical protein ACFLVF_02685, partial [Chloroflexota bacterium]
MAKGEFTAVSMDKETYTKLTGLSKRAGKTRAGYIRKLIDEKLYPKPDFTIKNGELISVEDLDNIERLVDAIGRKAGITVDLPFLRFLYDLAKGDQRLEFEKTG